VVRILSDNCRVLLKNQIAYTDEERLEMYKKFEDLFVAGTLANQSEAVFVLKEFSKSIGNITSTDLSEVQNFIRSELFRNFYELLCTEPNWVCPRVKDLCRNVNSEYSLECDEK